MTANGVCFINIVPIPQAVTIRLYSDDRPFPELIVRCFDTSVHWGANSKYTWSKYFNGYAVLCMGRMGQGFMISRSSLRQSRGCLCLPTTSLARKKQTTKKKKQLNVTYSFFLGEKWKDGLGSWITCVSKWLPPYSAKYHCIATKNAC